MKRRKMGGTGVTEGAGTVVGDAVADAEGAEVDGALGEGAGDGAVGTAVCGPGGVGTVAIGLIRRASR
jgi:hypothetical protein